MVRVQQPGTRPSTDRSPPVIPGDVQRLLNLRRRPARPSLFNLERPSLVDSTVPVATPAPIPHYTPSQSVFNLGSPTGTPFQYSERENEARLRTLQSRVTKLHREIIPSELTMEQRQFVGRIPEPEAVPFIAERVAGQSNWPQNIRGGGTAFWIAGFLTGKPRTRWTQISLAVAQHWEVPYAVRHEAAHHILGAQGVPKSEHEDIIARARIPGILGVNFSLLQMLIESYKVPSAEQDRRFNRRLMQLTLRELRRGSR